MSKVISGGGFIDFKFERSQNCLDASTYLFYNQQILQLRYLCLLAKIEIEFSFLKKGPSNMSNLR